MVFRSCYTILLLLPEENWTRIKVDGDYVDLSYTFEPLGFARIRRITGYLVGTMDHWNDAKRAEERDRVKHL